MNRTQFNFALDLIAFVCFLAMTATGWILKFTLPPGSGRSGAALLGMTRHEWGDIHFLLAVAMTAAILIHLALHWKWILCMFGGHKILTSKTEVNS